MRVCRMCGVDYVGSRKDRKVECPDCVTAPRVWEWVSTVPWRDCHGCLRPFVNRYSGRYCSSRCAGKQTSWGLWYITCQDCGRFSTARRPISTRCRSCQCLKDWQSKKDAKGWVRKASKLLPYIGERDRWKCRICGERVISKTYSHDDRYSPTVDHVVPRSQGGSDEPENLRLAHMICNALRMDGGGGEQLTLVG